MLALDKKANFCSAIENFQGLSFEDLEDKILLKTAKLSLKYFFQCEKLLLKSEKESDWETFFKISGEIFLITCNNCLQEFFSRVNQNAEEVNMGIYIDFSALAFEFAFAAKNLEDLIEKTSIETEEVEQVKLILE